jgi:excinuclease ABC subunit A
VVSPPAASPAAGPGLIDAERPRWIRVRGARTHNLTGVDVDLPRDALVVLTGPSGSGKSSLAFDTIFAEGQRRYVESLSVAARQFLAQMPKPEVDLVEGLSPTVAVDQDSGHRSPRSTVGTVTEIDDYLRLLFARAGVVHDPRTGEVLRRHTLDEILERVLALGEGARIAVLAPMVRGVAGDHADLLADLRRRGFVRVAVDDQVHDLGEAVVLDPALPHDLEVYVDRLVIKAGVRGRLADSVETALALAGGHVDVLPIAGERLRFSTGYGGGFGGSAGAEFPEVAPGLFSFNSPQGACPSCDGLGYEHGARASDDAPSDDEDGEGSGEVEVPAWVTCTACQGARLRPEALAIRVAGRNIREITNWPVSELAPWLQGLALPPELEALHAVVVQPALRRVEFLIEVGLGYLALARPVATLSGGELQRVRLAAALGAALVGVTYILDEPSVGLHAVDTHRLLRVLQRLRDLGNTVLVVEHDEDIMRAADWLVDLGPGAGAAGGRIVAQGTPAQVAAHSTSTTGAWLDGRLRRPLRGRPRRTQGSIVIRGAKGHNLRSIDVTIPLGVLTCVTGVSGSGKSSLVIDTLLREVLRDMGGAARPPLPHDGITGLDRLDRVIHVDQSPVGRSPRSNPATFTGIFAELRSVFAQLPDARMRGWNAARFSFNVRGGRCEACAGDGLRRVEMHFLPDVWVECTACAGRRYNRETLAVTMRGRNIADVLAMSVHEAHDFFVAHPAIRAKLAVLREVGLGYLTLGQSATTLSGGEAQRLKLARELGRRSTGSTLVILDEPTTGLHVSDIHQLMHVLGRLVDEGNTVVVIEHNLDVAAYSDWIIDLGPDGGSGGGEVVVAGEPLYVARCERGHTGRHLRPRLMAALTAR